MACACSKKKSTPRSYLHIASDGTRKAYSTELEAMAAQKRLGGTVRPQ